MTRLAIELNQNTNDMTAAAISAASMGSNTLVAAATGKIIRVHRLLIVAAGAVSAQFLDSATALTRVVSLVTGVPLILAFDTKPWFVCSVGNAFNVTLGGAVQISGMLYVTQS
jgi:hypothetical protein